MPLEAQGRPEGIRRLHCLKVTSVTSRAALTAQTTSWNVSNSGLDADMGKDLDTTRLCKPDPWITVDEAREQRGPVMARWLMAAVARVRLMRLWTHAARHSPASPRPKTFRSSCSRAKVLSPGKWSIRDLEGNASIKECGGAAHPPDQRGV